MSRDARLYLIDMRDACTRIMHHRGEIPRELFFVNDSARDAVLWNLLVLGEAAKPVPESIRIANPTVGRSPDFVMC